jgi:hypothetical protein
MQIKQNILHKNGRNDSAKYGSYAEYLWTNFLKCKILARIVRQKITIMWNNKMALSSVPVKENQQKPACKFENECLYADGCACKEQCTSLPGDSNLCRKVNPQCTTKMFFGYNTVICMCIKRQGRTTQNP